VCRSIFIGDCAWWRTASIRSRRSFLASKRLHRFGFRDLRPALFAGPALFVVPEVEHRLAESAHDIRTIEVDIFHERAAVFALEDHVLVLTRRAPPLDHHA
jgi:hypothetical protein